mmetsp:Transcript_30422/g.93912  ORF Transcript_30422/g.93912 Transcript_30422/m.93912 type:complete len:444 (-) Transcript_30422:138-1469(-)|eukprot:CAMPEP_0174830512 /NCGR_PEP_ID=MMETSP1114-20130205/2560_1 /TAXON_ID=312471 /ORGANISM="Neobodo designis, Strain CCAP 1951/1" /LENGTH=443 /DNA_ID=CAMNT_0016064311 /DNA_START=319 /DNA_END=1650 /DNA_ORIENTATION=+
MPSSKKSQPASPTAAAGGPAPKEEGTKSSYAGDFWALFFNGKSVLAEAFRKDPKLRANCPAFVLGRRSEHSEPEHIAQWVNQNVKHIHFFSYRSRFPEPLEGGLDHDAGWGCMIRTGQMMLCEAVRRIIPSEKLARHTQLLFRDIKSAPFGIHRMTEEGARAHIPVGQWFSPTALAFTAKRLVAACEVTAPHLAVVIGMDGAVKRSEISSEFVEGRPVCVMVPIMAGADKIPKDQQRAILKTFELPCSLGIVGGRPKHSLYFVGKQEDQVFYLDPHTVQPAFVSKETVGNAAGVRGTMCVADMDPSMVLCFLLKTNRDLDEWERAFKEVINPLTEYPLFSIIRPKPPGAGGKAASSASTSLVNSVDSSPASSSAALSRGPAPAAAATAPAAAAADDDVDDCAYDSDVEEEMSAKPSPTNPAAAGSNEGKGGMSSPQQSAASST